MGFGCSHNHLCPSTVHTIALCAVKPNLLPLYLIITRNEIYLCQLTVLNYLYVLIYVNGIIA